MYTCGMLRLIATRQACLTKWMRLPILLTIKPYTPDPPIAARTGPKGGTSVRTNEPGAPAVVAYHVAVR